MTHRSLHHLAVGSSNVERLAAFYRDVVGLPELARHLDNQGALRSIWLNLGGPILMIERTDAGPRPVEGLGSGPFLLAFAVSPAERLELEAALLANGQRIESRTAFTSYSRDVDGNRIAFSHYPEAGVAIRDVPP
jgi:glyoxylase I family protein